LRFIRTVYHSICGDVSHHLPAMARGIAKVHPNSVAGLGHEAVRHVI
jgi:hypothetical protein